MPYKVVNRFKDIKHGHIYEVGEVYPAEGEKATKTRLEQLATTKNKYKKVFIEKVEEESNDKE
ncbi:termination factor Rho [Robertmurraya sp. FSL W8-0741]|uniref:termination factor Rho n=1 Tax=Robertmurraya sp. FSL W8-0741 TaxID=2954629 RepID=UPI0030FCE77C